MKLFHTIALVSSFIFLSCHAQNTTTQEITPKDFAEKIKTTEDPQILDVRTPGEFASEHIDNAINVNWNSDDFTTKVAAYDKSKPVFIYCLSGGRSKKAAAKLNELGFTTVYELEGGIMNWKAEGMTQPSAAHVGMTMADFNKLLLTDKKVLVDFYAQWCGPCKQMEPYLLKMQKEMADQVTIIRIDVDKNKSLAEEMKINALPLVVLYENKKEIWKNPGYISEQDLKKQLQ
jgi:thioredoxin